MTSTWTPWSNKERDQSDDTSTIDSRSTGAGRKPSGFRRYLHTGLNSSSQVHFQDPVSLMSRESIASFGESYHTAETTFSRYSLEEADTTSLAVEHAQHTPLQRQRQQPNGRHRIDVLAIPSSIIYNDQLISGDTKSMSERSYTPIKAVGNGSFGTVWLCDWHTPLPSSIPLAHMQQGVGARPEWGGMRLVAIKRLKKHWDGGWDECRRHPGLESLRSMPPHENVILLYDCFLLPSTKELYLVFECMEGNLYQLIRSRKGRPFAGGLVSSIFHQICEGLAHIHDSGYFHRDMKPENLLVTTTGLTDYTSVSPLAPPGAPPKKDVVVIIKLADFGLARRITSKPPYTEYVSTRWYRAPEVLLQSTDYNAPVDLWALGTIMAEVVNMKPLFPGNNTKDQLERICAILGDPSDEYGFDSYGRPQGGGHWLEGLELSRQTGLKFEKMQPLDFWSLFDPSIPHSLIDCIHSLLRYDPNARLTAHKCLEHAYFQETAPRTFYAPFSMPRLQPVEETAFDPMYSTTKSTPPAKETVSNRLDNQPLPKVNDLLSDQYVSPPVPLQSLVTSPMDSRKLKKEQERLQQQAEKEARVAQERLQREQARAVLQRRNQIAAGRPDIEYRAVINAKLDEGKPKGPKEESSVASGSILPNIVAANLHAVTKFLQKDRGPRSMQFGSHAESTGLALDAYGPRMKRRAEDEDDDSSSSEVMSVGRMSVISFAAINSDPGPSRSLRRRPSLFNDHGSSPRPIRTAPSISSLRSHTSSPRSSHSVELDVGSSNFLDAPFVSDFEAKATFAAANGNPPYSPGINHTGSHSPSWLEGYGPPGVQFLTLAGSPYQPPQTLDFANSSANGGQDGVENRSFSPLIPPVPSLLLTEHVEGGSSLPPFSTLVSSVDEMQRMQRPIEPLLHPEESVEHSSPNTGDALQALKEKRAAQERYYKERSRAVILKGSQTGMDGGATMHGRAAW